MDLTIWAGRFDAQVLAVLIHILRVAGAVTVVILHETWIVDGAAAVLHRRRGDAYTARRFVQNDGKNEAVVNPGRKRNGLDAVHDGGNFVVAVIGNAVLSARSAKVAPVVVEPAHVLAFGTI